MKQLDEGYSAEADRIGRETWHDLMLGFDDASFFQTWSYGAISWGENALSHLLLRKNGKAVAIAQLRIARIPLIGTGVAYVISGPMWRRKNELIDKAHLKNMIRALYNEYVVRRRFFLQVVPKTFLASEADTGEIYRAERLSWRPDLQQTIAVDLSPSLDEIKKNMRKQWRQTLQRAEKQPVEIVMGSNRISVPRPGRSLK
jgi:lipid II:glycine glycyltransferase (peptidoglycan interpeptide bridge formation enzyme)